MRTRRAMILAAWWVLAAAPVGAGVAELRLDASAVAEVLDAALPEPWRIDVPGLGAFTVRVGPVRSASFREGTVEALVDLAVEEAGWADRVRLRFVPGVERTTGTVQLEPLTARIEGLPFDLDLARWIPPVRLPRVVHWELEMEGARSLPVICYVQGLEIDDDRLRVDLGLVGGGAAERAARTGR